MGTGRDREGHNEAPRSRRSYPHVLTADLPYSTLGCHLELPKAAARGLGEFHLQQFRGTARHEKPVGASKT